MTAAAPDPRAWEAWQTPAGVPDTGLLGLLATDASDRATAMLAGAAPAWPDDPVVAAIRLLATTGGAPHVGAVARATGRTEEEVRRLVLAHRHGGGGGVSAALAPTPCGGEQMSAAVAQVRSRRAFSDRELVVEPGEITDPGAGVRVRLGPDGRWHPGIATRDQWWPAIGADVSVGAAYQAAMRAKSLRRANN